ncbi:4'-phosphopantetheinyl transferase family protein [Sanguibacter keddieii]|uniref:4'-phosphopantetheinyl transferase family protein n=1 Tax=Sanguibacter keddieii TaxID=60920 RepID=UPI0001B83C0F|nr:4'-phosphopantetheinyl transferase superfamily protein [Sanguibacter keddieii]
MTSVTSSSAPEVLVVWGRGSSSGGPDDLLRHAVAAHLEMDPGEVQTGRLCPRCASSDHGRPVVLSAGRAAGRGEQRPVHVSLSRAAGRTVVAVTTAGPVGVDVEHVDAAGFDTFARVGLHRDETDGDASWRTRTWVRKESLVKATGDGLMVDLRDVQVTAPDDAPELVRWEGHDAPGGVEMVDLDVPGQEPGQPALLASLTLLFPDGASRAPTVITTRSAADLSDR